MKEAISERHFSGLKWVMVIIFWSLIAVFFASRSFVATVTSEQPNPQWRLNVISEIVYWYLWMPLTPLIFWFAGYFPMERKYWLRRGILIALFGLFITIFQISLDVSINRIIVPYLFHFPENTLAERLGGIKRIVLITIFTSFLTYLVIIGGYYSYAYYKKYRARDARANQLEILLAQSKLQILKMQLHPHFLFNTLHTISILINTDAESANHMLIRLSDLLRKTLEHLDTQEITLKEELEFLSGYLDIEQIRFRDRLKVHIRVDPNILDALVPSFILQPLAENAVRYGIAPLLTSGIIEINGYLEDQMIHLEVKNNGPGIKLNGEGILKSGIGLSNTRERLAQLYGEQQHFETRNEVEGGVTVSIIIPFHRSKGDDFKNGN